MGQIAFEQGQKETEAHLKSQLLVVCRSFCLQTWIEALNAAGVDSNSELRNLEKAFYPPIIRARPINQPSVSISTPRPASSIKNPQHKSNTAAPTQAKSTEQHPITTDFAIAKSTEQQSSTTASTKSKQTELATSKPSITIAQSTEVATKAPPIIGDSSTSAPPTSVVPHAPTSTFEVPPVGTMGPKVYVGPWPYLRRLSGPRISQ